MSKSKNELIRKRRKKILIKKTFFSIVLLIAILITLCLKLPYFEVKNIVVENNRIVMKSKILEDANIQNNSNIFYLNISKIKESILDNPYILDVKVYRKLPDTINISVEERAAVFYAKKGSNFIIIDRNGMILEEKNKIDNMKLIELTGLDTSKAQVGKLISSDSYKLVYIKDVTDIILKNDSCKNINKVDIGDILDFQVYYNNMCIKLGTNDEIVDKLNKAINIIVSQNLSQDKGYIDVSFNGNPVFFIQK